MKDQEFQQEGLNVQEGKTLDDFFKIKGGILNLIGTLRTINFISGKKGVQIDPTGLTATGGTINPGNTLSVSQGGTGATTLTGIIKGNGTSAMTAVAGVSGSFYAASTSGGSPTRLITVTNGIITAIV